MIQQNNWCILYCPSGTPPTEEGASLSWDSQMESLTLYVEAYSVFLLGIVICFFEANSTGFPASPALVRFACESSWSLQQQIDLNNWAIRTLDIQLSFILALNFRLILTEIPWWIASQMCPQSSRGCVPSRSEGACRRGVGPLARIWERHQHPDWSWT